jgi:myo-inositol 2-dehydrogenase/D-chiro-inositol 1-dehydrogenase
MTDRPLGVGVLGVGRIGAMHAELLQHRVDGAVVSGVFDVHAEGAAEVARRVGTTSFDSASSLINSADVDVVAICTSTDTHVDLIVEAASAGKPVFCEKPISLDLAEVDRALAAVEAAGVPLHIGFNRRFDPSHRAVRDAVADGTVGELRQVRITSRDPAPPPISYIEVSGGIFLDMTVHDFDMARYVTGSEVVEVYARGSVTVDPAIGTAGDLDTVSVMLTHTNGCITMIDNCRQASYGYDQRVEAFGSGGVAMSQNHLDHSTIIRGEGGGSTAKVQHFFLDRYIPSYVMQWGAFVESIRSGRPTPVSGADGRAPLVIGAAAWRSIREQRPVSISEFDVGEPQ